MRARDAEEAGAATRTAISAAERNAGRVDPAHPVREQDEQEQRDRQADARRERPDHALRLAPVVHHEIEGRGEAREDQRKRDGNEDVHGTYRGMAIRRRRVDYPTSIAPM
ncbi:hypothetical protein BGL_1c33400 [Burkholderia plantarii]|uniref:Uncharacterized protein n=1 Tax=Burkholderia plantarii TaxID=41899 RepID=A0A0B6S097_BURPL|nr:hypothetical protein BGL_1c33400 [Burkholderia plantarii]